PANIASFQPAVMQHRSRALRIGQIAFENVDAAKPDQTRVVQRKLLIRFRISNLSGDSRRHFSDRAQATRGLHLFTAVWLRLRQIHAYHRRRLRQSVSFENSLLESLFECFRKVDWKLLCAGYDKPKTAKLM